MASTDSETLTGRASVTPGDFYVVNTQTAGGTNRGVYSTVVFQPDGGTGYSSCMGVVGKATFAEDMTWTGGAAWPAGVQGILEFNDGATINNASSVFAAVNAAIVTNDTPIFTAFDTLAGVYIANHSTIDLSGKGVANGSAFISMQNHGNKIDHLFHVHGASLNITNFLSVQGSETFMKVQSHKTGIAATIQIRMGTTTYYIPCNAA